jgi:DNA-binding NarL/FixJ family response regulator
MSTHPVPRPLLVLVVDDSPLIQGRLRSLFGELPDVEVVGGAEDVAGAVAAVDALHPDVIVLDVELAHGDKGLDVVEHVRAHHPQMHVVALSNSTWQAVRDTYLHAGVEAYFDKALEFERARQWVNDLAGAHRSAAPPA